MTFIISYKSESLSSLWLDPDGGWTSDMGYTKAFTSRADAEQARRELRAAHSETFMNHTDIEELPDNESSSTPAVPTEKQYTLTGSAADIKRIIASVEACSASGGGSCQFSLLGRLNTQLVSQQHNVHLTEGYDQLVGELQTTAYNEYVQAHELEGESVETQTSVSFTYFGMPTQDYFTIYAALINHEIVLQRRMEVFKDTPEANIYKSTTDELSKVQEFKKVFNDSFTGKDKIRVS